MRDVQRVALEEHFIDPGQDSYFRELAGDAALRHPGLRSALSKLADTDGFRIEEMNRLGIEIAALSYFNGSGVQNDSDAVRATIKASEMNDFLARRIDAHPARFRGWGAMAMQDPVGANVEFRRCVTELGFLGAMINGHTHGRYLDEPEFLPFWETAAELDVPIYLHPSDSPPERMAAYRDFPQLTKAAWDWSVETAYHALRIICSCIFDRFPTVTLILGHMGELLPYHLSRFDQTTSHGRQDTAMPISHYIRHNVMITTSGNVSSATLLAAQMEMGADRIMFATDYPLGLAEQFTTTVENCPMSDADKQKIFHLNARKLLRL